MLITSGVSKIMQKSKKQLVKEIRATYFFKRKENGLPFTVLLYTFPSLQVILACPMFKH